MVNLHIGGRGSFSLVLCAIMAAIDWSIDSIMLSLLLVSFFYENSYLSPVICGQEERGHTVVSTGTYHRIRHPMYMAILVFIIGTSLFLGSRYGLGFVFICMAILARQADLEKQMLLKELSGYADYKAQVKYRLIPYVW